MFITEAAICSHFRTNPNGPVMASSILSPGAPDQGRPSNMGKSVVEGFYPC
jgi:hypothetical protein